MNVCSPSIQAKFYCCTWLNVVVLKNSALRKPGTIRKQPGMSRSSIILVADSSWRPPAVLRLVAYIRLRNLSHRISRNHPEQAFYMVPSHDKTRHVVVREAVLARCSGSSACAALYHRVHQSLPDSNLILKNTQALRRTTAAVRD